MTLRKRGVSHLGGKSRAGARLDKHIKTIISKLPLQQTMHHQPFYWHAQTNTAALSHYRNNETEKRGIGDIAPEEIIVTLQEVIEYNLSIEEEELLRYAIDMA